MPGTSTVPEKTSRGQRCRTALRYCVFFIALLALAGPAMGAWIVPDFGTMDRTVLAGSGGIPGIAPGMFSPAPAQSSEEAAPPLSRADGLSPESAANLELRIEETLYAFRYDDESGTWSAVNRVQKSTLRADRSGAVTIASANGSFGMQLAALGRGGAYQPAGPVTVRGDKKTLSIMRDGYTEWYVNGNAGIEQGMDIAARPAGTGPLRVVFSLSGGLAPSLDGQDLVFSDAEGPVFRYAGLAAQDANGKKLPARLILSGTTLIWEIDDTGARYPIRIDPLVTQVKVLSASDKADNDYFGISVAVDGTTAIVGAGQADSGGSDRGQAYIFSKDQGGADAWGQVAILNASDKADGDSFGYSVAVDGSTAVVGAYHADPGGLSNAGKAYVFSKDQGGADKWGQVKILNASDPAANAYFGRSVAVDRSTAVIGAYHANPGSPIYCGEAYVFYKDQGGADKWGQVANLTASDPTDSDFFGYSVAVDGSTAVVGADAAIPSGIAYAGKAYVFYKDQGGSDKWGQVKILNASDPTANAYFGGSVAVDGSTAVVGALGADHDGLADAGKAYVFYKDQGGSDKWGQVKILTASDAAAGDYFGSSVAVDGSTAVVGAYHADPGGLSNAGKAYVFYNDQGGSDKWGQVEILTASDAAAGDRFGSSVAVDGTTAIVGGYQADSGGSNRGQAYVFTFYSAPTYTGIAPATGTNDDAAAAVTITGTNYYGTPVVKLKKAGEADITATGVTITGDTTISCTFDLTGAAAGTWDVEITNPDAKSVTGAGAFTVTPPVPVAAFTGTPTTGTRPLVVQFNETSTNTPTSWNWSFGDGTAWFNTTLAAQRNATHTYTAAGTYTVTLIASNAGGSGTLTRAGYITATVAAQDPPAPPDNPPASDPGDGGSSSGSGPSSSSAPPVSVRVNIGGNSAAGSAVVTGTGIQDLIVTGTTQTGTNVPPPPGTVYQYIGLVPARFTSITAAAITFTVPAAWLEEHGIPPENVVMYHYMSDQWVARPTTVSGTENGIVSFTAICPCFSIFAITGMPGAAADATPDVNPPGNIIPGSGPAADSPPGPEAPVVTQTTPALVPLHGQEPEIPLPLLAIAGILTLAAGGFFARRWWIRRQNPALFEEYD